MKVELVKTITLALTEEEASVVKSFLGESYSGRNRTHDIAAELFNEIKDKISDDVYEPIRQEHRDGLNK